MNAPAFDPKRNKNMIDLVMAAGQLVTMWRRKARGDLTDYEEELWKAVDALEGSDSVNRGYLEAKNGKG